MSPHRDAWRTAGWLAPVVVGLGCLLLTGVVAGLTGQLYRDSEQRLLERQVNEAGAVLSSAVERTETSLRSIAVATNAVEMQPDEVAQLAGQLVDDGSFVGVALTDATGRSIASTGELVDGTPDVARLLTARSQERRGEVLLDLDDTPGRRRLVYAISGTGAADTTRADTATVVATSALPDRATGSGRSDGPFSDLDYALYLGPDDDRRRLLFTSVEALPVPGPTESVEIAFGDRGLTFVGSAAQPLAGRFARAVPWLMATGGVLFTALAVAATVAVTRGRRRAEALVGELESLNAVQRENTATLRRSLLPASVSGPPGTSVETGYWPADTTTEISGDFYDAFRIDDRRWAITVGDVCGKGADAAALTSLTRHTIRAAARHSDDPTEVLRWTHEAIAASGADTYVTVCFAFIARGDGDVLHVDLSLGGHPAPILHRAHTNELVGTGGTLLGMVEPQLLRTRLRLVAGDVLILYTDGLTDVPAAPLLPGELADLVGRVTEEVSDGSLPERIHAEVRRHRGLRVPDDVAILALHVGPG